MNNQEIQNLSDSELSKTIDRYFDDWLVESDLMFAGNEDARSGERAYYKSLKTLQAEKKRREVAPLCSQLFPTQ